jgi:Glu-tRNA(Gln) amidotransferase subunit E-like FAD-binding protein
MKDKFIKLLTEQDSFIQSFKKSASLDMIRYYNTTLNNKIIDEVNKMRKVAKSAVNIGGFEVEATYWFDKMIK